MSIRLGSHPANLSLFILRRRNVLEPLAAEHGWQVEWVDYPDGRQSADLLRNEEVDLVGTGSTPPLYLQEQGYPLAYLACSHSRPANSALLVRQDSRLQSIAELQGLKIASTVGSFTDHFIAQALVDHGLSYQALEVLDLANRSGEQALLNGEVEVWAALDPLLSERLAAGDVRTLGAVGEFIPNRSLFWGARDWLEHFPEQARLALSVLQLNDVWIGEHPEEAARILVQADDRGVSFEVWSETLRSRPWGILPADRGLQAEQQAQADLLQRAGLLKQPIDLSEAFPNHAGGGVLR